MEPVGAAFAPCTALGIQPFAPVNTEAAAVHVVFNSVEATRLAAGTFLCVRVIFDGASAFTHQLGLEDKQSGENVLVAVGVKVYFIPFPIPGKMVFAL